MDDAERRFLSDLAARLGGTLGGFERPGLKVLATPLREQRRPDGTLRPFWLAWREGAGLASTLPQLQGMIKRLVAGRRDHKEIFAPAVLEEIRREHARYFSNVRVEHGWSFFHAGPELPYRETEPVVRLAGEHRLALEVFDPRAPERLAAALAGGDAFAVIRQEAILALAWVTERGGHAWQVHVQTDPAHAQKGHGRQAAEEVTRHVLRAGKLPWFAARTADVGAVKIGQALGYRRATEEAWLVAGAK